MSNSSPPRNQPTDDFDRELMEVWQGQSFPEPPPLTRELAAWVERFDRRVFRRNLIEYAAALIVLVRTGFEIAAGDRHVVVSLTSIAAVLFIAAFLWWEHRERHEVDPAADANSYRTALLARIDQQIRVNRRVRYRYILPVWIVFVTSFVSGTLQVLDRPPAHIPAANAVLGLAVDFLLATALCLFVVWLNERVGLRRLLAERERVLRIQVEGETES